MIRKNPKPKKINIIRLKATSKYMTITTDDVFASEACVAKELEDDIEVLKLDKLTLLISQTECKASWQKCR